MGILTNNVYQTLNSPQVGCHSSGFLERRNRRKLLQQRVKHYHKWLHILAIRNKAKLTRQSLLQRPFKKSSPDLSLCSLS